MQILQLQKKSVVADISVASEAALISKLSTLADTMAKDLENSEGRYSKKLLLLLTMYLHALRLIRKTVLEDMEVFKEKSADEAEALIPDEFTSISDLRRAVILNLITDIR